MIEKYSASATNHLFWFLEFKKYVNLLNEGKTNDDIKQLSINENIFSASTKARAEKIYNIVPKRINSLDKSFYDVFLNGDLATQKLFTLISIMMTDRLFFDFIYEVIREKMIIGSNEISEVDIRVFFKNKQSQDERVAKWTDYTFKKLGSCYKTMLYEAGVIEKSKDKRKIYKPILEQSLKTCLENNNMGFIIKALTGVR